MERKEQTLRRAQVVLKSRVASGEARGEGEPVARHRFLPSVESPEPRDAKGSRMLASA